MRKTSVKEEMKIYIYYTFLAQLDIIIVAILYIIIYSINKGYVDIIKNNTFKMEV